MFVLGIVFLGFCIVQVRIEQFFLMIHCLGYVQYTFKLDLQIE